MQGPESVVASTATGWATSLRCIASGTSPPAEEAQRRVSALSTTMLSYLLLPHYTRAAMTAGMRVGINCHCLTNLAHSMRALPERPSLRIMLMLVATQAAASGVHEANASSRVAQAASARTEREARDLEPDLVRAFAMTTGHAVSTELCCHAVCRTVLRCRAGGLSIIMYCILS